MRTLHYLVVLGVGTTFILRGIPHAVAQPQNFLLQNQQLDNYRRAAPLPSKTLSSSVGQRRDAATFNLSQKNAPDTQLPPLKPAGPTPSPTRSPAPPAPSPAASPAPAAASPEDLNLNRLNPSPDLLEIPTKPDEVQLQPSQPITLQQAIELARRNNRDLQAGEFTLRRARSALREAQAALYPTLNVEGRFTGARGDTLELRQVPGAPPGISAPTIQTQESRDLSAAVAASYDIYTSGRRTASIRAAEQQVRFNELEVERLIEQLRLDVSNDYYDVQEADSQVLINRAAVDNARASVNDALALERAGLGTRFDVLQAQVSLANSTQDLTNAIAQQQTSRRQLANRLSLGLSASVSAADPVQKAPDWGRSLDDSIVLAFQNRAELLQQIAQRNISEQQRRIALAQLGPQLSLDASYRVSDRNDGVGPLNNLQIGPVVTLNVFDGGAAQAQAAQEKANIRIAETNFANTRNQIRFAVEQAYNNLQSSFDNIKTSSASVDQANESLRLARLRFQAGVGIQSDVLDAVAALAQAQGNRVQAILGYNRSLATLQREVSNLRTTARVKDAK